MIGTSAAGAMWARTDVRRRWRSLTVIALLAGITGGLALASLAGARRTNTAFDRLRATTHASDAVVFSSQVGKPHPDWSQLAARPEVAQLTPWLLAFGLTSDYPGETVFMGPVDGRWGTVLDKPIVEHGRMFDPKAPDEMVVDEVAAKEEGIKVGTTGRFHAYGPKQDDTSGDPPNGAEIDLHVVGIVRMTPQFLFTGMSMLSPGVLAAHGKDMLWIENAFVKIRPGSGGVPALQRDANRLIKPGTPVLDLVAARRRIDTTTDVEQSALMLLAVAIAAAGLVLVGQVLGRSASQIGADAPTLRAVGMTRGDLAAAGVRSHAPVAIGAALVAIATAVVASRWFPVGLAARIDPDRGMRADWLILVPGALVIIVLVLGGAYVVAARASRPVAVRRRRTRRVVAWVRHSTPVPVGVGATMAFDRQPGRGSVAVRPAVIGAVVGVLGVVGALTIDHGLNDALTHPERAGVTWDSTVQALRPDYDARGLNPDLLARTRAVPGVRAVADVDRAVIDVNGVGVPGFTLRQQSAQSTDPIAFTIVAGRAPVAADEVALGPSSAHDLHVGIGDTVAIGTAKRPMRVVGRALFPNDVHSTFDQGLWLSTAGWDSVMPANQPSSKAALDVESVIAVRFTAHADAARTVGAIGKTFGSRVGEVDPANVPPELLNLRNVRRLPMVLAIFLALLAIAALTYVLVAITRARRRDFAVLRALGFTRGQSGTVMAAQSTAISLIGLLIGIPLGVLLGRTLWRLVTERVPLQDVPPFAAVALFVIVPVVLIGANLLAAWPARRVARLRAAEVLRTE